MLTDLPFPEPGSLPYLELFKHKIRSLVSIDETGISGILSAFRCITLSPGNILVKEDTTCKNYYFLERGLLRLVYCSAEKEETAWVIFEGAFFSEIIGLKSKKPGNIRIEALEECIVLDINEHRLNELCDKVPPFEKYLRLTWEDNLYHVIQMKLLQQFSTARQRYEILRKDEKLMQRIPQKYLASILGITPYSLSRLRNPKNG